MRTNPSKLKQSIILRSSGYSLSSISERTGISASTLYRHFKTLEVRRGDLSVTLLEEAKQQLLQDAGFINELRYTIAASIVDDLAIVRQIRESLVMAVEELAGDKTTPASLKSRALAALSTTLSITQAVSRKALNLDQIDPFVNVDTIPTLTIRKMTDEDCLATQKSMGKDDDDELAA